MLLEWLLTAMAMVSGVRTLGVRERPAGVLLGFMALAGAAAAVATSSTRQHAPKAPVAVRSEGFVTSKACRSCHPAEYSSWHDSYHRRMTQSAALLAVAAPELRQGGRLRLASTGRTLELFADQSQLWARLPDPGVTAAAAPDAYAASYETAPLRNVPVQLLTGSHHQQTFWVAGARQGELRALPAVYLVAEQRLIARRDAFLNPPDAAEQAVRWNSNCVQCHTVAGAPAHDDRRDSFATSAAELGIACEACHGAGAAHVQAMRNPLARYRARGGSQAAVRLVNPRELSSERASQICGRCHSYFFPKHEDEWWQHGFTRSYAPGQDLAQAQLLLSPEALAGPQAPRLAADAESLFYRDGTIRIGGREYNGLVRSPCFERGHGKNQLSCLSCHSLHRGAADDQLDPDKLGNGACQPCHERQATNLSSHTHHPVSSTGSLCYNCHMPYTSYALLRAIRSHRIDTPSFDARTRDRPNACSLCHLDQSEAWAAARATVWYGKKASFVLDRAPGLGEAEAPAGAVFALAGDAAVRAITAAALGRHESSRDAPALRAQLLGALAGDDYAAVRAIAAGSRQQLAPGSDEAPLAPALVARLLAARDQRPVTIAE